VATVYVRGTNGNNANTGADWNNAKQTITSALTGRSTGDIILVDNLEGFTQGATLPATWNPSDLSGVTLSGGNLIATTTAGGGVRSTIGYSAGKYYWENTIGVFNSGNSGVGVASSIASLPNMGATGTQAAFLYPDGTIYINTTSAGISLGARSQGDVIGIALDVTAKLVWFRVSPSGLWNNSGTANPATGVGGFSCSVLTSPLYGGFGCSVSGQSMTVNFGDNPFIGAVPAGFAVGTSAIAWVPPAINISILSVTRSGTTGWTKSPGAFESIGTAPVAFPIGNASGSAMYVYGMRLIGTNVNTATSAVQLLGTASASSALVLDACTIELPSTSSIAA
jgi:hypothetical protein